MPTCLQITAANANSRAVGCTAARTVALPVRSTFGSGVEGTQR
jgi:hypothetical protein